MMRSALAFLALAAASCVAQPCLDGLSVETLTLGADGKDVGAQLDDLENTVENLVAQQHVLPSASQLGAPTVAGQIAFDTTSSRMLVAMSKGSEASSGFEWRDPHSWLCFGGYANGVLERGEECDDDNDESDDACHGCAWGDAVGNVASARGAQQDTVDSGQLSTRALTFSKQASESSLLVTYTENIGLNGPDNVGCRWEVLFNGASCPTRPIRLELYATNGNTVRMPASITAACEGLEKGGYSISIAVSGVPGNSAGDCHTGFSPPSDAGWHLTVLEVTSKIV